MSLKMSPPTGSFRLRYFQTPHTYCFDGPLGLSFDKCKVLRQGGQTGIA